jgi:TonB family protein
MTSMPAVVSALLATLLQGSAGYAPPRVTSSPFGGLPYGARAAGLVVLDVDVDEAGAVRGIQTVKDLEPFGPVLREDVSSWVFDPARRDGIAVAQRVLVVGAIRPAMLEFPAPSAPPAPPADAPRGAPYPTFVGIPPYPANHVGGAAVLVETRINEEGTVTSARIVGDTSGFDDASVEAARRWVFRPARQGGHAVSSYAYLLFVYREPQ